MFHSCMHSIKDFLVFLLILRVMLYNVTTVSCLLAKSKGLTSSGFSPPDTSESQSAESLIECQLMCDADQECMSYFFNNIRKVCVLETIAYSRTSGLKKEPGWMYMQTVNKICPTDYLLYRELNICYKLYNGPYELNVTEFRKVCKNDGAELLKIDNKQFNDHVNKYLEWLNNKVYRYAIQGRWNESKWVYDDGTEMVFFNWRNGTRIIGQKNRNIFINARHYAWIHLKLKGIGLKSGVLCGTSLNISK